MSFDGAVVLRLRPSGMRCVLLFLLVYVPIAARAGAPDARKAGASSAAAARAEDEPAAQSVSAAPVPEPAPVIEPAAVPEPAPAPYAARVFAPRPLPPPESVSDFSVRPEHFAAVPRTRASELLTLAPGVLLTNHGGEGHAPTIFLRGFDAGEGEDLEVSLEGLPLNELGNPHGHGYVDLGFVIPELVYELRVVEGPFLPTQGDFAVAGSAEYTLGLPSRGLYAAVGRGSFDEERVLLLWGPDGAPRGTFVGLALRRGEGFGPSRAHADSALLTGFEHRLADHLRLRLVAGAHANRFDSAGLVREDDVAARALACPSDEQWFCVAADNQGGAGARQFAVSSLRGVFPGASFSQQLFASHRTLRLRENFTGHLLDPRGDGTEQRYGATTIGLRGLLELRPRFAKPWLTFEAGYLGRHDLADIAMYRLRSGSSTPWATLLDQELTQSSLGVHLAAIVRPFDAMTLRAGVRRDAFFVQVEDENRPATTRAGPRVPREGIDASAQATSPRLLARLELVRGLALVAGFGMGLRSTDPAALSEGEAAPFARVRAIEAGALGTAQLGSATILGGRLVGFTTHVDRDLLFDPARNRNVVVGASSRVGALALAELSADERVELRASLTATDAHLLPPNTAPFSRFDGELLPYVPRLVSRLDLSSLERPVLFGEQLALRTGVGLTHASARPLPLGAAGEPFLSIDAGVRARLAFVEAGLSIENLLDARNRLAELYHASQFMPGGVPSALPSRHFAAGPPRRFLVTLALVLEHAPELSP